MTDSESLDNKESFPETITNAIPPIPAPASSITTAALPPSPMTASPTPSAPSALKEYLARLDEGQVSIKDLL